MISKHNRTLRNAKNRTETGQTKPDRQVTRLRLPKTHQDYWKTKLQKRSYRQRDGTVSEIPEWQVRIQYRGRENWFNLGTSNQTTASQKARDIWLSLQAAGLEATLSKYKPDMYRRKSLPTVGEFLNALDEYTDIDPKTLTIYAAKFRRVVAGIKGLEGDRRKYDYVNGGSQAWRQKLEAVKLSEITPDLVRKWRKKFITKAGNDKLKIRTATRSANSFINNAKCLFAPKHLKIIEKVIELPETLPFEDIRLEGGRVARYKSEIDPEILLVGAKNELAKKYPEQYLIFLLALGAGLRRNEIDKLEWSSILWSDDKIRVQTTRYFQPKTEDSEGDIDVDPDLLAILRLYWKKSKDDFVVPGNHPRPSATYDNYRCARHFNGLTKWLRTRGITAKGPLHSLRKEFGSGICQQAGIFAASEALRHSNIRTTRDSYLDKKERVTFKIGKMLKESTLKAVS